MPPKQAAGRRAPSRPTPIHSPGGREAHGTHTHKVACQSLHNHPSIPPSAFHLLPFFFFPFVNAYIRNEYISPAPLETVTAHPKLPVKMAESSENTGSMSDYLARIPDNISIKYLPDQDKLSSKVLQKGLNYFTQGYIHEIKVLELENTIRVEARCWASMKKNQPPHHLHMEITEEKFKDAYCSCKAGVSGHCSHVVGLIKSLQGFKLHNFTTVPDQLSCTSIPQQWHVPRGSKIKPVPLNHVVVARPTESRKRKPVLCQIDISKKYELKSTESGRK